jgi:hypothetical protein
MSFCLFHYSASTQLPCTLRYGHIAIPIKLGAAARTANIEVDDVFEIGTPK